MYGYGYGTQNVITSSSNGSSLMFAILIISLKKPILYSPSSKYLILTFYTLKNQ